MLTWTRPASRQLLRRAASLILPCFVIPNWLWAQSLIATIPTPAVFGMADLAVNSATNLVYVGSTNGDLTVIDGATNTITGTVPAQGYGVAVNEVTNRIYAVGINGYSNCCALASVRVIDGTSNAVLAQIDLPDGNLPYHGIAVNPITNTIYVAEEALQSIYVIDGSTNQITGTVFIGHRVHSIGVNSATNRIYVTVVDPWIAVIDGATNNLLTTVPVAGYSVGIDVNPQTSRVYVQSNGSDTVSVIDGTTNSVIAVIPVPTSEYIAVNTNTNRIYVGLSVIDGSTNTVVAPLPAGSASPGGLGVNRLTSRIYAGDHWSQLVAVIGDQLPNQPPVITTFTAPPGPLPLGSLTAFAAQYTDADSADIHNCVLSWGDSSNPSNGTVTEASGNGTCIGNHTFTGPGIYPVTVTITDGRGGEATQIYKYVVIYDPNGGFTTGGGSVQSPAGADLGNPSAAGPATFGFVSKYLHGRSTPDGNLEFQFQEGNLNFKSTSMDWLVVTGEPRSIFRGTGTINGANVCKFEVDAWDGSFQPGNVDGFGLKIFSCGSGGDRYSLPARPLTKGSIIIHRQ